MRTVHPDFSLAVHPDGGHRIVWRGESLGRARPLAELAMPATQECFIVGTGPSINEVDFEQLAGRDCIGVNGSIVKARQSGLAFRSTAIMDRKFFTERYELVCQTMSSGTECLFSFRGLSAICERTPELLENSKLFLLDEINGRYGVPKRSSVAFDTWAETDPDLVLHPSCRPSEGRVGYSLDPRKGVFTGQTIVYSALQVATWLGYRRIFLLGVDLGGATSGIRFYESGADATPMRLDHDYDSYILPAFETAREVAGSIGVMIYNLSPDSRLPAEVIPRLGLQEALEGTADSTDGKAADTVWSRTAPGGD